MHGRIARYGWFAIVILALLAGAASLSAQTISGVIAVHVQDANGKPLGAVSIEIKNPATGRSYNASTDPEGNYRFPEIPPGVYEVTAAAEDFQTLTHKPVQVNVNRVTNEQFTMKPGAVTVVVEVKSTSPPTDPTGPTQASSFPEQQARELPVLTRDVNNLGLLASGVLSVRTFSFGSTLVPFSVNGSRGRDNNFIIDSVDNNEPLFGGAATQFSNTDIIAEYNILTTQLKAEFGRNSGATVNLITKSGSNRTGGTLFWYGQHDALNARSQVEEAAGLTHPARYYENQIGATLGGPIVKDKTFYFLSYQWDRTRNNLSNVIPVVATYPTPAGLAALRSLPVTPALLTLLNVPSVTTIPSITTAPCFDSPVPAGFNNTNPCRAASSALVGATSVPFSTYLVQDGNAYDVKDHQLSGRLDHRLSNASDIYARYLFDEVRAPRRALSNAGDSAFSDLGVYEDYRLFVRQRSQSMLLDHRYYGARSLNEFRFSFSRISTGSGAFALPENVREKLASATIADPLFGGFGVYNSSFVSAGRRFTIGRDSSSSQLNTNSFQFQENFSYNRGNHSMKFGANFVRIQSNINSMPSDLGEYFFGDAAFGGLNGLQAFATESAPNPSNALFAIQRLGNVQSDPNTGLIIGQGDPRLKLREFDHFYFFQDDWRVSKDFTLNVGVRYENFGQPFRGMHEENPRAPIVSRDNNNFAPRIGFAWAPYADTVIRGGYGIMYNPMVLNIPLLVWQSAPISPFFFAANPTVLPGFTRLAIGGNYPNQPFTAANMNVNVLGCSNARQRSVAGTVPLINCSTQDTVDSNLKNPYVHNFSLGVQQALSSNMLFEVGYVGSKGTRLFQRTDENPNSGWNTIGSGAPSPTNFCPAGTGTTFLGPSPGCILNRTDNTHGAITKIGNGGSFIYHSLQTSLTRRMASIGRMGTATFTVAYTWSHNIDNTSEIFGPGARIIQFNTVSSILTSTIGGFDTIEAISPYAQDPRVPSSDRGNSSFDRRHRFASSYLWELGHSKNVIVGGWQLAGIVSVQSGQSYTPLNGSPFGACYDPAGFGRASTARPAIGNVTAPLDSVALLKDPNCTDTTLGYKDGTGATISPSQSHFVQVPLGVKPGNTFAVGGTNFIAGSAGRNSLVGPGIVNWDFSVLKNFRLGETRQLQFRAEIYDLLNHRNAGNPTGNVFTTDAQFTTSFAFSPRYTAAGATGVIPENAIDAFDPVLGGNTFGSRKYMNTSSRRIQFGLKLFF
jgi:carboxypeptidase family protein/TonB-dependent receptor-like protein